MLVSNAYIDLSNNYLSTNISSFCTIPFRPTVLLRGNCFDFTVYPSACTAEEQRTAADCAAFCGLSSSSPACGGKGVCYLDGPSSVATCSCQAKYFTSADNVGSCVPASE